MIRVAKVIDKANNDSNRIIKEANLIKNLKHPDIPLIYDIVEDNDSIYIIEEYIAGKSLREYITEKQDFAISLDEICRIGIELCYILEYLHNTGGIIHMDLKPDNIIIDNNKKVKLIDFDNAVYKEAGLTVDNGTMLFAAPEQYLGEKAVCQSDVYSVGVILLYMATNGHIKEDSCLNLAGVIKENSVMIPVIKKCIRHNLRLRYSNIGLIRKELQAITKRKDKICEEHSYILNVLGITNGIGTTNLVLCMAHFFEQKGVRCIVVDKSERQSILDEALQGEMNRDGTYTRNNVVMLPDYRGCIEVDNQSTRVIIVDCGNIADNGRLPEVKDLITDNSKSSTSFNILVVGGKGAIYKEKQVLEKIEDNIIVMTNLLSAKDYYEYNKIIAINKKCYRIPCIYNWNESNPIFDETMNDFLRDNMTDIYHIVKPGERRGFVVRLYERIKDVAFFQ